MRARRNKYAIGPDALPLEVARRKIEALFGPWHPIGRVNSMSSPLAAANPSSFPSQADFQAFEAFHDKWFNFYYVDATWGTGPKWEGVDKGASGGTGGGNYYDRAAIFYVRWARTGDVKWLERANALIENERKFCYNGQYAFTVSATPGGAALYFGSGAASSVTATSPTAGVDSMYGWQFEPGAVLPNGSTTPGHITWYDNILRVNDPVVFTLAGGALPPQLTAGQTYYVKDIVRNFWGASGGVIQWLFRGVLCHWLITGDPADRECLGAFASAATHDFYRLDLVGGNTNATSLQSGGFDGLGHNAADHRTWARCLDALLYAHLMHAKSDSSRSSISLPAGPKVWSDMLPTYLNGILSAQGADGAWRFKWVHGDTATHTTGYEKPFMAGLLCDSLIQYYRLFKADSRIVTAVKKSCDSCWDTCFVTPAIYPTSALGVTSQANQYGSHAIQTNVFRYADFDPDPSGTDFGAESNAMGLGTGIASNLNLMLASNFAWIYHMTGDVLYRDRADKIFKGAISTTQGFEVVTQPQHNSQKSLNELYTYSYKYPYYRSVVAPAITPAPPADPGPGSGTGSSGSTSAFVTWQNLTGFVDQGSGNAYAAAGGVYYKQARSVQTITADGGYFEFIHDGKAEHRTFLHSGTLPSPSAADSAYAFRWDGAARQAGNFIADRTPAVVAGDVCRITIIGGVVKWYVNGTQYASYTPGSLTFPYYMVVCATDETPSRTPTTWQSTVYIASS